MDYVYPTPAESLNTAFYTSPAGILMALITIAAIAVVVIPLWKVFRKASRPGWAAIIPIYNMVVLCQITGRPAWWFLLILIPVIGPLIWLILSLLVSLDLAKAFGKSPAFGIIGLWLFTLIGYYIIGFDKSQYQAPTGADTTNQPLPPQAPLEPTMPAVS